MLYAVLSETGFRLFGHSIYTDDVDIARESLEAQKDGDDYDGYAIFSFEDSMVPVLNFAYLVAIQACCDDGGHFALYTALLKVGGKIVSNV